MDYFEGFGKVVMTHNPIRPYLFYRFELNIHGHTHRDFVKLGDTPQLDLRYYNVCCEPLNYTPRLIEDIIQEMKEKFDGLCT